jgi:hypothetical protein
MAQFYRCFIKKIVIIVAPINYTNQKDIDFSLDKGMSEGLGVDQIEVY